MVSDHLQRTVPHLNSFSIKRYVYNSLKTNIIILFIPDTDGRFVKRKTLDSFKLYDVSFI